MINFIKFKYRLLHDNKNNWYYCQYSLLGIIWFCESFDYGICIFTNIGGPNIESIKQDWMVPKIYKNDNINIYEVRYSTVLTRLLPKFKKCLEK